MPIFTHKKMLIELRRSMNLCVKLPPCFLPRMIVIFTYSIPEQNLNWDLEQLTVPLEITNPHISMISSQCGQYQWVQPLENLIWPCSLTRPSNQGQLSLEIESLEKLQNRGFLKINSRTLTRTWGRSTRQMIYHMRRHQKISQPFNQILKDSSLCYKRSSSIRKLYLGWSMNVEKKKRDSR